MIAKKKVLRVVIKGCITLLLSLLSLVLGLSFVL